MRIKERVISPTPKFFRKVRSIGVALIALSGAILTAPISIPASLITLAGYAGVAGAVMSAVSQMAVEDAVNLPDEPRIQWKINKPTG